MAPILKEVGPRKNANDAHSRGVRDATRLSKHSILVVRLERHNLKLHMVETVPIYEEPTEWPRYWKKNERANIRLIPTHEEYAMPPQLWKHSIFVARVERHHLLVGMLTVLPRHEGPTDWLRFQKNNPM